MKPSYSHSFPISTPSLVFPNYTQVHQTFVSRCPTSVYNLLYQNLIIVGRVIQKFSLSRDRKSSLLTQFLLEEHLGYPLSFPIMSYFFLFNLTLLPLYEWFLPNQSKFSGVSFFFFLQLFNLSGSFLYLLDSNTPVEKMYHFFSIGICTKQKNKTHMHVLSTEKYISDFNKFNRGNKPSYMSAQEIKKRRKQVLLFPMSEFQVLKFLHYFKICFCNLKYKLLPSEEI